MQRILFASPSRFILSENGEASVPIRIHRFIHVGKVFREAIIE